MRWALIFQAVLFFAVMLVDSNATAGRKKRRRASSTSGIDRMLGPAKRSDDFRRLVQLAVEAASRCKCEDEFAVRRCKRDRAAAIRELKKTELVLPEYDYREVITVGKYNFKKGGFPIAVAGKLIESEVEECRGPSEDDDECGAPPVPDMEPMLVIEVPKRAAWRRFVKVAEEDAEAFKQKGPDTDMKLRVVSARAIKVPKADARLYKREQLRRIARAARWARASWQKKEIRQARKCALRQPVTARRFVVALKVAHFDPTGKEEAPAVETSEDEPDTLELSDVEKLLVSLSACKIIRTPVGFSYILDFTCAANRTYADAQMKGRLPREGIPLAMVKKLAEHESAAVRFAVVRSGIAGEPAVVRTFLLTRAREDKEAAVVAAALRTLVFRKDFRDNPAVVKLLIEKSEDENEIVRAESVGGLAAVKEVPRAAEIVLEKIEKDPSLGVREFACAQASYLGAGRALPVLVKNAGDENIGPACTEGLGRLAWGPTPNESAHRELLSLMKKTERTAKFPPFSTILTLSTRDLIMEPWFDRREVADVLETVVLDPKALAITRSQAAKALKRIKKWVYLLRISKKLSARVGELKRAGAGAEGDARERNEQAVADEGILLEEVRALAKP